MADGVFKMAAPSGELGWLQPKHEDGVWWPVHVRGPAPLKSTSHDIKESPTTPEEALEASFEVYCFGTYKHTFYPAKRIKPWSDMQPVRSKWRLGRFQKAYQQAMTEVELFLGHVKTVEPKLEHDASKGHDVKLEEDYEHTDDGLDAVFAANSIVWAKVAGYPWLPAYVLDVHQYDLSRAYRVPNDKEVVELLGMAQRDPYVRVVYYFQSHNFGLHTVGDGTLHLWLGEKHATYTKPNTRLPSRDRRRHNESVEIALAEVEEFRASNRTLHSLQGTYVLRKLATQPSTKRSHAKATPPAKAPAMHVPIHGRATDILDNLAWMNRSPWLPWMPVFVFDAKVPRRLLEPSRASTHGAGVEVALERGECAVFDFGLRQVLSCAHTKLKPWICADVEACMVGQPVGGKDGDCAPLGAVALKQFDKAMATLENFINTAIDDASATR